MIGIPAHVFLGILLFGMAVILLIPISVFSIRNKAMRRKARKNSTTVLGISKLDVNISSYVAKSWAVSGQWSIEANGKLDSLHFDKNILYKGVRVKIRLP
ncbi:hypothetical protein [Aquitalea sp. USM4]|uniref:hypothetical protein n=1 Tax=Aquitalea sp. USM4 TaxID=1590041 RepID=UPI00103C1233|nr:hypothetical protein [Aquitalea sp. USM4]